jgi:hypothetical protein
MGAIKDPLYSYVGRVKGGIAYKMWKESLLKIKEGEVLWLNFPAEQIIDPSFADESIIRLGRELYEMEFGDRFIRLCGLSPDSIININAAIKWHDYKVAFLSEHPHEGWQIIGWPPGKKLLETFEVAKARGHITAPEFAAASQIALNTASTRLYRLYSLRLIRRRMERSHKGIEYIYSV